LFTRSVPILVVIVLLITGRSVIFDTECLFPSALWLSVQLIPRYSNHFPFESSLFGLPKRQVQGFTSTSGPPFLSPQHTIMPCFPHFFASSTVRFPFFEPTDSFAAPDNHPCASMQATISGSLSSGYRVRLFVYSATAISGREVGVQRSLC